MTDKPQRLVADIANLIIDKNIAFFPDDGVGVPIEGELMNACRVKLAQKIADSLVLDADEILKIFDKHHKFGIGTLWTFTEIDRIKKAIAENISKILKVKEK